MTLPQQRKPDELRREYIVCRAAGYPDPHSPFPNTRENAERFARDHRRLPNFPAIIKTRLVSEWTEHPYVTKHDPMALLPGGPI